MVFSRRDSFLTSKEFVADSLPLPAVRVCSTYFTTNSYNERLQAEVTAYYTRGPSFINSSNGNLLLTSQLADTYTQQVLELDDVFPWCRFELSRLNCSERASFAYTERQVSSERAGCAYTERQVSSERAGFAYTERQVSSE